MVAAGAPWLLSPPWPPQYAPLVPAGALCEDEEDDELPLLEEDEEELFFLEESLEEGIACGRRWWWWDMSKSDSGVLDIFVELG